MTNAFLKITKIVGEGYYNKSISDYIGSGEREVSRCSIIMGGGGVVARRKAAVQFLPIIPETQANITPAAKPKPGLT